MLTLLLRHFRGLPLLLLLALGVARPAQATHLLGGEITYRYLGALGAGANPFRYEVSVFLYIDVVRSAPGATGNQNSSVTFYSRNASGVGAQLFNRQIPISAFRAATPRVPNCPGVPQADAVNLVRHTATIDLPFSAEGYYAYFTEGARNNNITNLANSGGTNLTLVSQMSPPLIQNASPTFADTAVAVVCEGDTTYIVNNATDADGDRLTYSFGTPYGGNNAPFSYTPPPAGVQYAAGYSTAQPFGNTPGNLAQLNASNGLSAYSIQPVVPITAPFVSRSFVVAVDVNEYRTLPNGTEKLIGTTRRDLQIITRRCPAGSTPVLAGTGSGSYTIEEGQALTFAIGASTTPATIPVRVRVTSALLDGPGGFNATYNNNAGTVAAGQNTGTVTLQNPGTATGSFVFNSRCGDGRATPYDVIVAATAVDCKSASNSDVYQVTVTRAAPPTGITGPTVICDAATVRSYSAAGGPTRTSYNWRVTGGTITAGQGTGTVQVQWNSAVGAGQLVLKGVSGFGCLTDSVTASVDIRPLPAPAVTPAAPSVCTGVSTTLSVTPVAGVTYIWSPATGLNTTTGPTVIASPTTTTTYTVTATETLSGCTSQRSVTVTVTPVAVSPSPGVSFCSGGSARIGNPPVAGNTYLWSPATGLSSATVAQPTVTLTNTTNAPITTTYTLTVTNATGCVGTGTVAVTVNPAAVAVAGPARAFCSGASAQLGAAAVAGYTYAWTPATGLSSATAANPTVTGTNTGTTPVTTIYRLIATNSFGCLDTARVAVTVNPAAVATPGPARAICSGASAQLGAAPLAGYTYLWSPATGLSSATVANPTVTLTNTTNAAIVTTYTLTATNGTGCISTATVVVTVNPAAVAAPGPAVSFCSGASAQLGAAAVAGYTYSWSPATGLSSATAANPTVTLTNAGTAATTTTYTLTATNSFGCTSTGTVVVTVNPAAVATPGPARAICSGASAQLGAAAVAGYTYTWSPTTGLSSATVANPTVTLTNTTNAPVATTYTLTATNSFGCAQTGTVVVTVNPLPVAVPGPAVSFCSGASAQLGAAAVAGNTYLWSPATGLSSATAANPTVTLTNTTNAATTTTYTLTVTTAAGCTGTGTVVVTVNPAAVAVPGPAVAICSGKSAQLGAAAVAGYTYSWSPATGLSSATVANPTVTMTNTGATATTTTYTLTATNSFGCTNTGTVVVTVNPAAVATAGPARTFCSGASAQLGGPATAGTTYAWTPALGLSSATASNPTVTLTNTTNAAITRSYRVIATTASGCLDSARVNVTVNPAAVAVPGPAVTICSGLTAQLGGPAVAGYTYSWSPATGLSSATVANPTVTTTVSGLTTPTTYTLTATNSFGCSQTGTVVVTANAVPMANPGPAVVICSGATAQLGGPVLGIQPPSTYLWSPATGLSSATVAAPTLTLTNTTAAPITTVYTLTVTTIGGGCVSTATVSVTVNPAAIVSAGPAVTICDGRTVRLGTPGQPGYTYAWTPATGLSSASVAQPTFAAVNPGTAPLTIKFFLTATTSAAAGGCSKRDSVLVTVNPRPTPAAGIAGPRSVCPTVTGIAYSVPNPAGTAYQWLVSGGTIAGGQGTAAITVNWGAANATASVKVFRLNAQGCSSDTTTLPVIINTILQTPTPTGPTTVCQADGPYTYSALAVNGSLYSWQVIGGTQASSSGNSVTVSWNPVTVPTFGKIVVTETSNPASGVRCLGVSDTLRVLINPSPRPSLALTGPARACQAAGTVAITLPGGFAGSTYAFTLNGAPVTTTGNSYALSTTTPGTYVVTARETTAQGCVGPVFTKSISVDAVPAPLTISGSRFFCDNAPQTYSVANATAGAAFQWTVAGGSILSGQGTSQVSVQFAPGAGTYAVSVQETSAFGCGGLPVTITIKADNPTLALTVASVTMTSNNAIDLTLSATNSTNTPNAVQVLRRVAGSAGFATVGTVPAGATTFTDRSSVDAAANSYEYQLQLTNGCGTVLSSSTAQTIRLQATGKPGTGGRDQGTSSLSWNAYAGFAVQGYQVYRTSDVNATELLATVPATTLSYVAPNGANGTGAGFRQTFRVVAVGPAGLLANSNTASTDFANATNTYNVITPNGDGLNDVLVIDNIQLYPGNTFEVYSRWGRQVFQTSNYQNNWGMDGVAPGVYYYLLTVPGGATTKGWVEVVK